MLHRNLLSSHNSRKILLLTHYTDEETEAPKVNNFLKMTEFEPSGFRDLSLTVLPGTRLIESMEARKRAELLFWV